MVLFVMKIGGSVITDKNQLTTAKTGEIKRIVSEISEARKESDFDLILVNGAGSFGHIPVKEYGVKQGIVDSKTRFGTVMVHKHVEDLNRMIWNAFIEKKVPAIPVHPMSFVVHNDWVITSFDTRVIEALLKNKIVPLLYGDMVMDETQGASIISGDDIVPYLAEKLNADKVLLGSDTDGVFDKNPKVHPDAKLIPVVNKENFASVLEKAGGADTHDLTGGMREKLRKTVEQTSGKPALIFNALTPGNVKRVLLGENIGTSITVQ